jgi:hypothetical protein
MKIRVTKLEVLNAFIYFCADLGKKVYLTSSEIKAMKKMKGKDWDCPCETVAYSTAGAWCLDYQGCYGGWQIEEFDNDKGGISRPLTAMRFKAYEFVLMIHFARQALRVKVQELSINGLIKK